MSNMAAAAPHFIQEPENTGRKHLIQKRVRCFLFGLFLRMNAGMEESKPTVTPLFEAEIRKIFPLNILTMYPQEKEE